MARAMTRNPRKNKYTRLRSLMAFEGVTQADLAYAYNDDHPGVNKFPNWVSRLMCGREEWKLSVMYWVLDYFDIPHHQLNEYFPPDGEQEDVA